MEKGKILFDKWLVENAFPETGQGETGIVRNTTLEKDCRYVIKILKSKENSERKERFKQEIRILQKLDLSPEIPAIMESSLDIANPYYVMEYIEGRTLTDTVNSQKSKCFDDILIACMNLIQIMDYYHRQGLIHRDIKPDNIICRNSKLKEVSLVDFGIAYDENFDNQITRKNDELGNRFLSLPELKIGDKQDFRSDITLCVAILFFMITGNSPKQLSDSDGYMPHQRFENVLKMQWIGSERLKIINLIFNKGFSFKIDQRFQNLHDLVFALNLFNIFQEDENISKQYKLKTLSFTGETMSNLFRNSYFRDTQEIERLKKFNNMNIYLGNAHLIDKGDRWYIRSESDLWLYKKIKDSVNCNDIGNLYISKNQKLKNHFAISKEIDNELTAKIHFINDSILFTDFRLSCKNIQIEIEITSVIEILEKIETDNIIVFSKTLYTKDILTICNQGNIVVYRNNVINETIEMQDFTNDGLWEASYNGKYIYHNGEKNRLFYVKENNQYIKSDIMAEWIALWDDFKFLNAGNRAIFMSENKIYVYDFDNNKIVDYINIKLGKFIFEKFDQIEFVDVNDRFCIVNNNKKKLKINLYDVPNRVEVLCRSEFMTVCPKYIYNYNRNCLINCYDELNPPLIDYENVDNIKFAIGDYWLGIENDNKARILIIDNKRKIHLTYVEINEVVQLQAIGNNMFYYIDKKNVLFICKIK
nr:serine/threonine-protein kinase [uncultured Caproiciproducens sp.]